VCEGTPVHYEQTVRERVPRPGSRMRRVCEGRPANYEQTVKNQWPGQGGGRGDCVRVHRYTMSKQSRTSGQVKEEDAASVYGSAVGGETKPASAIHSCARSNECDARRRRWGERRVNTCAVTGLRFTHDPRLRLLSVANPPRASVLPLCHLSISRRVVPL